MTPNSRSYLNHFSQPDSIVPDPGNSQDWDRYSYARNNPVRYNDPTGHTSEDCHKSGYACRIHQNQIYKGLLDLDFKGLNIIGDDWGTNELLSIYMAWALLIKEFGSEDALTKALGGVITFVHTPPGFIGGAVARAIEPLNLIVVDSDAFPNKTGGKMTWYALHEIAHIFDMNGSNGDPAKYKSNWFVNAYNSGCKLSMLGCTGAQWNPSNKETTGYGLSDGSVEDFADSFASTILHNNNMEYAGFGNVGTDRMNIINVLIVYSR